MSNRYQTMTNTKFFSVFAIVAVAAMMGAASIAPAYAAAKTSTHEETKDLIGPVGAICDSASVDLFVETNVFTIEWNNGHFKIHSDFKFTLYDTSTGDLVGTIPGSALNFQGKNFVGPISIQLNTGGIGACTNGTPLFEIFEESHCGQTFQRTGDTISHNVACVFD